MAKNITPEFHLPTEIYINYDIMENIADILSKYGSRLILITTENDFELYQDAIESMGSKLKKADFSFIVYDQIPAVPNTEDIDIAVTFTKKTQCDVIIGFGSVEAINSAKTIALLTNNYIFCDDLFQKPTNMNECVTFITMPAYPAFGFEIAPMLYLNEIHGSTKKIYYNESLYPKAAIVDPTLSLRIDEDKSMQTSISALALSMESVISKHNNDIINTYALKSIDLTFRNLPLTYRDSHNSTTRIYLSTASVMSGIAFSTAYLSVTLAISLALASLTELSVEKAMCIILPHIMEFNLTSSPGKYVQMSKVMGEDVKNITVIEAAIKSVEAIRKLESDVAIPQRLSTFNIEKTYFEEISKLAMTYPFYENAPRSIDEKEIETILIAAY
ncbi:iron-containing alcohol dehydrogenase [Spirochaetota bacterium]